jgi:hypothetical protein
VALPWEVTAEILGYLHQIVASTRIDERLHMFVLQLLQGLYRQAACGKTGLACFKLADTLDCVLCDLAGGKTDPTGEHTYAKRMAPNFEDPRYCFVTALARHVFSRRADDDSPYLYMLEADVRRYKSNMEALVRHNSTRAVPGRVRDNGPHTKFRIQFGRVIADLHLQGIPKDGVTVHSLKRMGYRQVRRLTGIEANDVALRADHRSSLAFVYGGRPASRKTAAGGGPDDRRDMSMAKVLANRPENTISFNRNPPHFKPDDSNDIPFESIVPCYHNLPADMQELLPFLLAQLLTHYHSRSGQASLGNDNPLLRSPLWSETRWIAYRHELHGKLLGGRNPESAYSSQLRDPHCDLALQLAQILKNQAATMALSTHASEQQISLESYQLLAEVTGIAAPAPQGQRGNREAGQPIAAPVQVVAPRVPVEAVAAQPLSDERKFFVLSQAPPALTVPPSLTVEEAWHKFFRKDKWYQKTAADIDPSVTGLKRKNMRGMFNKAKDVVVMMLGSNTPQDLDRAGGAGAAFQLARQKIGQIWHHDILQEFGVFKSVRTVYNIMTGVPEAIRQFPSLTSAVCKDFTEQCKKMAWPAQSKTAPIQSQLDFNDAKQREKEGDDGVDVDIDDKDDGAVEDGVECSYDAAPARQAVECFACTKCSPPWLTPDFPRYLSHVRDRHNPNPTSRRVQEPMMDEVECIWAHKRVAGVRNSAFESIGNAFHHKHFSREQRLQLLRQRIVDRSILQRNDHIVIQQQNGKTAVGIVVDPALMRAYNALHVTGVLYLDSADTGQLSSPRQSKPFMIEVASIMNILPVRDVQPAASVWSNLQQSPIRVMSERFAARLQERQHFNAAPAIDSPKRGRDCDKTPTDAVLSAEKFVKEMQQHAAMEQEPDFHADADSQESDCAMTGFDPAGSAPEPPSTPAAYRHDRAVKNIIGRIFDLETCDNEKDRIRVFGFQQAALNSLNIANDALKTHGWRRCEVIESGGVQHCNLEHDNYKVVQTRRDGNCLFHTLVAIAKKLKKVAEGFTQQGMRAVLADHYKKYASRTHPRGGINVDGGMMYCEDDVTRSFGGEIDIFAFCQIYQVHIESHCPDVGATFTYGACYPGGKHLLLQTYSWKNWSRDTGDRSWGGDHWQQLEPKAPNTAPTARRPTNAKLFDVYSAVPPRALTDHFQTHDTFATASKKVPIASPRNEGPSPAPEASCAPLHPGNPVSVQIMLRAVESSNKFLRNAIPNFRSNFHSALTAFSVGGLHFLEEDYGHQFQRVYPSDVQLILGAFPDLDETCRSFFIALGIGANLDPFRLQTQIRAQGRHLTKLNQDGRCMEHATLFQAVNNDLRPNCEVHHKLLRCCWPPELDTFCVHVIDGKNHVVYNNKPGTTDIILRRHKQQYTLLVPIEGACTAALGRVLRPSVIELLQRCPCMPALESVANGRSYVAASLPGSDPTETEIDSMWKTAYEACGLQCDPVLEKWLNKPKGCTNRVRSDLDGSMRTASWKKVQQELLDAFDRESEPLPAGAPKGRERRDSGVSTDDDMWDSTCGKCGNGGDLMMCDFKGCTKSVHIKCIGLSSVPKGDYICDAHTVPKAASSFAMPIMFVDAGSESGKGMYRMMSDKRITHVAGVELSVPWFHASVEIFSTLRTLFIQGRFRMPEVTIFESDMLAQTPDMKYLYSSAAIMWQNNFVFGEEEFCARKRGSTTRPQPLLKGNTLLSYNSAFNFSEQFEGVTYIAVHLPDPFDADWNFTPSTPFPVNVTWGAKQATVTIVRHVQRIKVEDAATRKHQTCSLTQTKPALDLWADANMRWNALMPTLQAMLQRERYFTNKVMHASSAPRGDNRVDFERDGEPDDVVESEAATWIDAEMPSAKGTVTIRWPDLSSLMSSSSWLSCSVIEGYLELLASTFPHICFHTSRDWENFASSKQEQPRHSRSRPSQPNPLNYKGIIIFILNVSKVHWISAKLDKKNNYIAIADSLHKTFEHLHPLIYEYITLLAKANGHTSALQQYTVTVPDQNNTFDCGALSCLFTLHMAQNVTAIV